jgi:hypothetical protein
MVALILFLERRLGLSGSLDGSAFRELLSVTAQIAGLFLGLYFTAVSVVASTTYSRVSSDVRSLLTREKVGNFYIGGVAFLAMVCLLLLGARAIDLTPGVISLVLVVMLAAFAVLSFLVLGLRIFHFFDPTRLVVYLAQDFDDWAGAATASGFRWNEPSFQAHYQRRAEHALNTFKQVVALTEKSPEVDGATLGELGSQALALASFYGETKLRIPSDSYWFRRVYEHRDWLTADHTRTQLALATGTGLAPDPVPDALWVEREIGALVARIVRRLIADGNHRDAVMVTESLTRTLLSLGRVLAIEEAVGLQRAIAPIFRELGRSHQLELKGNEEQAQKASLILGLTDSYSSALLALLLGTSETLRATRADSFTTQVSSVNWAKGKSLYLVGVPRNVLKQFELIKRGVDVEVAVEGSVISPSWYSGQLAALGLGREIELVAKRLLEELEETFPNEVEALVKSGRFAFAAQLLQRGLEACNKFAVHFEESKETFESVGTLRQVTDIPWPGIDWAAHQAAIESARQRLVVAFGQSAGGLMDVPRSPYWPDYFGHASLLLAEECFETMISGDEDLFGKLFPPFFLIALSASDRVRKDLEGKEPEAVLLYSFEPIKNLLEVSGWALVFSELDSLGFWNVAKEMWDEYFSTQKEAAAGVAAFLNGMVEFRQGLPSLMPGDLSRTGWKQRFAHKLRQQGLLSEHLDFGLDDRQEAPHSSAIVRTVIRGGDFLICDPHDIFMALYLLKRPEAAGLTPTRRVESFMNMLEREEEKDAEGEGPDERGSQ